MRVSWLRRRVLSEARLAGRAAWYGFIRLITGTDPTHAAAIAYYALLSLFPFLLLLASILGSVTANEADRAAVLNFVLRYFPTQVDFVASQLDALAAAPAQVGGLGALALVWASLGVFGAVTSAVNVAWGVERQRSFLQHRLVSFLMLAAAGGATLAALVIVSSLELARASWFGTVLARYPWLDVFQSSALEPLALGLFVAGVGLVFYFLPNAPTRLRDVWGGAVLTGLLWRGAFDLFSWWMARGGRIAFVQGSIATVVVFLLWIYVSALILLYGVEFTAAHARLRRRRPGSLFDEDAGARPGRPKEIHGQSSVR
ncbi:MAG: YihY/virulence factor BrkB family protein [Vicinamibacterales bacterium]